MTSEEIRPRTEEDKAAPVTWYLKWATENGVTPGEDVGRYVPEDDRRYYGDAWLTSTLGSTQIQIRATRHQIWRMLR